MLTYITNGDSSNIKNIIIFLHGYGSSGQDLMSLSPFFKDHINSPFFISPNATYKMSDYGYYWFDLGDLDPDYLRKGIDNAMIDLGKFINQIKVKYKIENKNIILCGFSQGGALALHYGLSQKESFKSIISFSGGSRSNLSNYVKNKSPICLIHGEEDEVLPCQYSINAATILEEKNHICQLHLIPNLAHSIDNVAIECAINFLTSN